MSTIGKLLEKWKAKRALRKFPSEGRLRPGDGPPVIDTPWGPTTESARRQAALNMKADPVLRGKVEELLMRQLGSISAGMEEARRRYPEAYQ
jgi:hypothetical protein